MDKMIEYTKFIEYIPQVVECFQCKGNAYDTYFKRCVHCTTLKNMLKEFQNAIANKQNIDDMYQTICQYLFKEILYNAYVNTIKFAKGYVILTPMIETRINEFEKLLNETTYWSLEFENKFRHIFEYVINEFPIRDYVYQYLHEYETIWLDTEQRRVFAEYAHNRLIKQVYEEKKEEIIITKKQKTKYDYFIDKIQEYCKYCHNCNNNKCTHIAYIYALIGALKEETNVNNKKHTYRELKKQLYMLNLKKYQTAIDKYSTIAYTKLHPCEIMTEKIDRLNNFKTIVAKEIWSDKLEKCYNDIVINTFGHSLIKSVDIYIGDVKYRGDPPPNPLWLQMWNELNNKS
uniref:Uncharacterized protein n=1 Tax=viral metagenome TaxID=1070528 RepID=A0A6C0ECM8_9ZZZZ